MFAFNLQDNIIEGKFSAGVYGVWIVNSSLYIGIERIKNNNYALNVPLTLERQLIKFNDSDSIFSSKETFLQDFDFEANT